MQQRGDVTIDDLLIYMCQPGKQLSVTQTTKQTILDWLQYYTFIRQVKY